MHHVPPFFWILCRTPKNFKNSLISIAKLAIKRKTGARGLRAILEDLLLDTMYEIPSSSSVKEVIIDKAVVETEKQPIVLHVSDKKINNIRKASWLF